MTEHAAQWRIDAANLEWQIRWAIAQAHGFYPTSPPVVNCDMALSWIPFIRQSINRLERSL